MGQQIALWIGGVAGVGLSLRGLYTGRVRQRSVPRRWVQREDEPGRFWLHILFYSAAALGCWGKASGAF